MYYVILCGFVCKMRFWSIFWDENFLFILVLLDVFEDKDLFEMIKFMKFLVVCFNDIFLNMIYLIFLYLNDFMRCIVIVVLEELVCVFLFIVLN